MCLHASCKKSLHASSIFIFFAKSKSPERASSSFITDQMCCATMGCHESRCRIMKALSHKHCTGHNLSASNCRSVLMVVTVGWWPEGLVVARFVLRQQRLGFHGGGTRVSSLKEIKVSGHVNWVIVV
ncbi:hypothetical protein VIGAN_01079300, partial [Vigna angularis var. angularis]